jgi:hypothetical protein
MTSIKRILIATFVGLICGLICLGLASSNPSQPISLAIKLSILTGRTLLGFTIGISALKMNWWLHGITLGVITSIPMAVPIYNEPAIFLGTFVMGIIYGILIEFVTTKLFKAKRQ